MQCLALRSHHPSRSRRLPESGVREVEEELRSAGEWRPGPLLLAWMGVAASGDKEDESQTFGLLQREMKSLRIPFVLRGGGQSSRGPTVPEDSVPWPSLGRVIPYASMEASEPTKRPWIRDLREIFIHEIYRSGCISMALKIHLVQHSIYISTIFNIH